MFKSLIAISCSLSLLAVPCTVLADTDDLIPESLVSAPAQVREAILRYGNTDLEQWQYTRTRVTEEGTIVDRHEPTRPGPEHWQLLSIDGREPTADEFREFEDDRADHSDDEEKARTDYVIDVIQPGSIEFLGATDGVERYAYRLRSPDGKREKTFQRLSGDMLIQSGDDGPWVKTVRVWNTETLRPIIGVRIDEVMMSFHFDLQQGYALPAMVEADWRGAFLMLKDIERRVDVTLSDFEQVLPPPLTDKPQQGPAASP